jgi:hypothetical protein
MRENLPRRYEPIGPGVLDRLSSMAAEDMANRFMLHPRWSVYGDRVLCVALCQGAALHYLAGEAGVKDFDVWTFFARVNGMPFPPRWRTERRFDVEPFADRYVDFIGRCLPTRIGTDPMTFIEGYLGSPGTRSARLLAQKAVVILDPEPLRGRIAWPRSCLIPTARPSLASCDDRQA